MARLQDFYNDARRVLAEARMIAARGRITLVVEGDGDARFLRQWIKDDRARVVAVSGKDRVKAVWRQSDRVNFRQIVCLADVDFDAVIQNLEVVDARFIYVSLGKRPGQTKLVLDAIDIEGVLVKSGAFRKVLCLKDSASITDEQVENVRERLRACASAIGALRAALAKSMNMGHLANKGPEKFAVTTEFFEPVGLAIDRERLEILFLSTIGDHAVRSDVQSCAVALHDRYGTGWALCRGHDLTSMLAMHLSDVTSRRVSVIEVEQSLKLAYEESMLRGAVFGMLLDDVCRTVGRTIFVDPLPSAPYPAA